ncbi:hypothetical protein PENSPDRAFT_738461 [Peniophora sp. CONT]|nr:hypothetical protein PENSPDRAFT_738461 [Peniophora sp. CONT]
MTLPAGSEDVLIAEGWRKLTEGPYSDAWHQYWGKDLELSVTHPCKAWNNALVKRPRASSTDGSIQDLARIILGDESDVVLPSCTFLQTPWADELLETRGRIMIAEGYNHVYGQINDLHTEHESPGVIVEGQSGIGKTYLALYLLVLRLSTAQPVLYSPHASLFIFFHADGVLESDGLEESWFMNGDFQEALPERSWIILDTRVDEGGPTHAATAGHLFPVRICRPEEKYFSNWRTKERPDMLVLDLPSPSVVLAGALIQDKMRSRKEDLARLLSSIRDFGPCTRYCYLGATRQLDLHMSLRAYIAGLSSVNAKRYPVLAARGYNLSDCLRSDDGPDIFALRRDYRDISTQVMLPVIASRFVMGELREHFAFSDLYNFREMTVIRKPPDDMEHTRLWLFEHLCHALFSEGDKHDAGFADLSPCFPGNAGDKLLLEHVFRAQTIQFLDTDLPSETKPESYLVVRDLSDTTFHSLLRFAPYSKRKRVPVEPEPDRAVTRGLAKQMVAAVRMPTPMTARVTRSTKRTAEPASPGPVWPPAKRPRVKAEKRFVVVYQMLLDAKPVLSRLGLERLERMRSMDPYAQYFFVFVTLLGEDLDLESIPEALIGRFRYYHLQLNLDLHPHS